MVEAMNGDARSLPERRPAQPLGSMELDVDWAFVSPTRPGR